MKAKRYYAADPEKFSTRAMIYYYANVVRYLKFALKRYDKRRALIRRLTEAANRTPAAMTPGYVQQFGALTGELAQLVAEQIKDDSAMWVAGLRMQVEYDDSIGRGYLEEHDRDE